MTASWEVQVLNVRKLVSSVNKFFTPYYARNALLMFYTLRENFSFKGF